MRLMSKRPFSPSNKIGSITTRSSDPCQFTYKAKRSTVDAVSCLRHATNAHLDKGCKDFKAVFLDFSNIFNTLPRQGLLDKFAVTNSPNWLTKWVHNYFTGRSQYTRAHNKVSSTIPNNCGVLQGAVLSRSFSPFILVLKPFPSKLSRLFTCHSSHNKTRR